MSQPADLSLDEFRALARAAGLNISEDELPQVKTVYEHLAELIAPMRELDLGSDDLAVSFAVTWGDEGEATR